MQTHSLMLEMKKMNEAIQELHVRNGTSTEQSLVADVKKMNQTINELAKRNMVMENLMIKMANKENISFSHI